MTYDPVLFDSAGGNEVSAGACCGVDRGALQSPRRRLLGSHLRLLSGNGKSLAPSFRLNQFFSPLLLQTDGASSFSPPHPMLFHAKTPDFFFFS